MNKNPRPIGGDDLGPYIGLQAGSSAPALFDAEARHVCGLLEIEPTEENIGWIRGLNPTRGSDHLEMYHLPSSQRAP